MKKTYFIPVLALGLIFLSGCGLWSNFTTYFNLYYNATEAFNDAEIIIQKQKRSMFVLEQPKLPSEANAPLAKVIEKCSKLLQFNKESGYVDDALFMLGKAFFYQLDYLKSTRKFNELIAAYPESELALEADLWIAKNELRIKDYEAGLSRLREVRARALEKDNEKVLIQTYAEEAAYYIYMGDIDNAIAQADKIMEVSGDKTLSAEALYQIGLLHAKKEEYAKAADAFVSVKKYSPSFEIEALSEIEYAKALREIGDLRGANNVLQDAGSESKYEEFYGLIEYETALTKIKENDHQSALELFTKVDTTYRKDSVSGMAQFQLAKMMEEKFHNFEDAKDYYNKAASSQASAYYKTEARKRAALLTKYENMQKQIAVNVKDLHYIEDPEAYVKDSTEAARLKKELSGPENDLEAEAAQNNVRGEGSGGRGNAMSGRGNTRKPGAATPAAKKVEIAIPVRPKISADSVKILLVKSKLDLGNLFLTEFNNPDSAAVYYADIVDNYTENIYTPRAIYALANCKSIKGDKEGADELFNEVYEKYPQTDLGAAAADILKKPKIKTAADPAETTYISAEEDLEKGDYRVSISKMYNIYKTFPKSDYAPKALYSAGWIYENKLELIDSAISAYDTLRKVFPATEYSRNIIPKLAEFKKERERLLINEQIRRDSIEAANKPAKELQTPQTGTAPDTLSAPIIPLPANDAEPADTTVTQPPKDEKLNQDMLNETLKRTKDGEPVVK